MKTIKHQIIDAIKNDPDFPSNVWRACFNARQRFRNYMAYPEFCEVCKSVGIELPRAEKCLVKYADVGVKGTAAPGDVREHSLAFLKNESGEFSGDQMQHYLLTKLRRKVWASTQLRALKQQGIIERVSRGVYRAKVA